MRALGQLLSVQLVLRWEALGRNSSELVGVPLLEALEMIEALENGGQS
jgi:hypothetical protein